MKDNLTAESPGDQLEFPLVCHYKIITENREGMHFVIETVLQELGSTAPLLEGNKSSNGKYVTFNVSLMVRSKDEMNLVDRELRNIEGVRMVL